MIIISFILDGLFSKIISGNFFTLTSIILAYYFYKRKNLYISVVIVGLLYDITYTNTLIIHALLFLLIIYLLELFSKKKKYDLKDLIIINSTIIISYILFMNILFLFKSFSFIYIIKSFVINNLYFIILYIFTHKKIIETYN